jgi:NAD(P)-dependent dehydrogenase (short-subunit alcohol dehydrogenase family)
MAKQGPASSQAQRPAQHQTRQPGLQSEMQPAPESDAPWYRGSGKLEGKKALITGGDSGIGRAVATLFAREGADVAIVYYDEHDDAAQARQTVEREGARCITLAGDIGDEDFCRHALERTLAEFGGLDILVNNASEQHVHEDILDISTEQLERTFRTNIFAMFHMIKAALPHLREGSAIINTASVTAYHGHPVLLDYSATKGAIVSFTRSLALNLVKRGIRVNAVAPGPIWTPLIPASMDAEMMPKFGSSTPMQRAGQPEEVAPCYVFLAARDGSYMSGQVLHPNGGQVVNG